MARVLKLKLRQRIGAGFTAVLLLLLAVSGLGYALLNRFSDDFVEYRTHARESNGLAEIEVDILMARLSVKDFLIDHEAERRGAVERFLRQAGTLVTAALEKAEDSGRRGQLDAIDAGLKRYAAAFAKVVALDGESRAVQADRLDASGPAMERELTEVMRSARADADTDAATNAGETLRSLLLARLYVQRYAVSREDAHAARVRAELAATEGSLGRLAAELADPARRALARDAARHFGIYRAAFEDKVRLTQAFLCTVRDELDVNGRAVAHGIDALRAAIRADQDALGPKVVAEMGWGRMLMLGAAGLGLCLGAGIAYGVGRSITRPIAAITRTMVRLAEGDLSVSVPSARARDEVGDMARAVEVFKRNGQERERLMGESEAGRIARARRQTRLESLNAAFRGEMQAVLGEVSATTEQMRASAAALIALSEDAAGRAAGAGNAACTASTNIAAVVAATETMTASIHEIGGQVGQASLSIREATEAARGTGAQVADLVESARRIGEVVTLIQAVAGQTNLLALNATIEAARAGEAGRGFAVVAGEVKTLAGQTARATDDIARQVAAVQGSTDTAAAAMRAVARSVEGVDAVARAISAAVARQTGVTGEIGAGIGQAADGAERAARDVTALAAAMEGACRAAAETGRAAETLAGRTGHLTAAVDRFLADVAAA